MLAAIVEAASVFAGDERAEAGAVSGFKCDAPFEKEDLPAGWEREDGTGAEGEGDAAGELHVAEVQRVCADIGEADELEVVGVRVAECLLGGGGRWRVVVDFGNEKRARCREDGSGLEVCLGERAPFAACALHADFDSAEGVQIDRACIDGGGAGDCAAGEPWVAAVEGVIDGAAAGGGDDERVVPRDDAAVLAEGGGLCGGPDAACGGENGLLEDGVAGGVAVEERGAARGPVGVACDAVDVVVEP